MLQDTQKNHITQTHTHPSITPHISVRNQWTARVLRKFEPDRSQLISTTHTHTHMHCVQNNNILSSVPLYYSIITGWYRIRTLCALCCERNVQFFCVHFGVKNNRITVGAITVSLFSEIRGHNSRRIAPLHVHVQSVCVRGCSSGVWMCVCRCRCQVRNAAHTVFPVRVGIICGSVEPSRA